MRRCLFLLLIGLIVSVSGFTQIKVRGSVKGVIVDSVGHPDLSEATVSVTEVTVDSSAEAMFTTTDKKGAFLVKNLRPATYRLLITFEGYRHIRQEFTIGNTTRDIDLSLLYMQKMSDMLQE